VRDDFAKTMRLVRIPIDENGHQLYRRPTMTVEGRRPLQSGWIQTWEETVLSVRESHDQVSSSGPKPHYSGSYPKFECLGWRKEVLAMLKEMVRPVQFFE
jgi:hypothetical protein